jgi:hypothetical protein
LLTLLARAYGFDCRVKAPKLGARPGTNPAVTPLEERADPVGMCQGLRASGEPPAGENSSSRTKNTSQPWAPRSRSSQTTRFTSFSSAHTNSPSRSRFIDPLASPGAIGCGFEDLEAVIGDVVERVVAHVVVQGDLDRQAAVLDDLRVQQEFVVVIERQRHEGPSLLNGKPGVERVHCEEPRQPVLSVDWSGTAREFPVV